MRILLVEDDLGVAAALTQGLRRNGLQVMGAHTAQAGLEHHEEAELVLLDMGLPDRDGLWLCEQIRARSSVPIVALTARRAESAVVAALRAGVDDYITKPYSLVVLLARIEAVMRRVEPRTGAHDPRLAADGLRVTLDAESREVSTPEGVVPLTAKEFQLVTALLRGGGRPVSRAALMEEVWDTTWIGASRTLDVHIATLRNKLGTAVPIETVRGIGYRARLDEPPPVP